MRRWVALRGGLGLLLLVLGCTREDLPGPAADSTAPPAAAPRLAAAAEEPVPKTPPVAQTREQLRQALASRFDATRIVTQQVPGGGVLHIPNGWAPHAMVAVRNPDGTISRRCVSSSAEAAALVGAGGTP